ncbi:MAG: flagellar biosynthesis protein FlhF [Gammaproteobacteria bacterium]|nr:flagellar biosynthesis protein FlhF [Gammaproteobacteria bacterium]
MKIKRFSGSDMRQAIRKVRDALGADAVILSNRKVAEGVEVVAAIDYDESLFDEVPNTGLTAETNTCSNVQAPAEQRKAVYDDLRYSRDVPVVAPMTAAPRVTPATPPPANIEVNLATDPTLNKMQAELQSLRGLLVNQLSGLAWENESKYHPMRARILQRFIAMGLSPQLARELAAISEEQTDIESNWRRGLGSLAHRLPVMNDEILNQQGVVAVVGATGVGKTTTVAKLAARYLLRHGQKRVGLITTDNYRVAAHEQLRSYARIMGAPLRVATDVDSLREALQTFRDRDLVLIDTAGMSQRDMRLNEQFNLLKSAGHRLQVFLALAANNQRTVLNDVTRAFKAVPLAGCVLTKVDETTSLGGAFAVAIENQLPIAYLSDGQQVPEDLHPARAHALVSRAVSIMQDVGVGSKDDPISQLIGGMVVRAHG